MVVEAVNDGANNILPAMGKSGSVKITIAPCQPKTLTHLPKRPPVDIAFSDLTYTVSQGKSKPKLEKFEDQKSILEKFDDEKSSIGNLTPISYSARYFQS